MAKEIITDSMKAAQGNKADSLRAYANGLITEMEQEQGKVYAVASAGREFVGPDAISERYLFEVIEGLCEDALRSNRLRELIGELAQLAGSTRAPEKQEASNV